LLLSQVSAAAFWLSLQVNQHMVVLGTSGLSDGN